MIPRLQLAHSMRTLAAPLLFPVLLIALTGCAEEAPQRLWGSGMLEAEVVTVASLTGGRILVRPVQEGDRVERGALVAAIDSVGLVEARDQARVGLAALAVSRTQAETVLASADERLLQARRTRDRLKALLETEAVARSQLDDAETAVTLATQQVSGARTSFETIQVEERRLRLLLASIARQIGDRLVDPQRIEGGEARAVVIARKLDLRGGKTETTLFAQPVSGVAEVGRWSG